jgi:hypothetical protein
MPESQDFPVHMEALCVDSRRGHRVSRVQNDELFRNAAFFARLHRIVRLIPQRPDRFRAVFDGVIDFFFYFCSRPGRLASSVPFQKQLNGNSLLKIETAHKFCRLSQDDLGRRKGTPHLMANELTLGGIMQDNMSHCIQSGFSFSNVSREGSHD